MCDGAPPSTMGAVRAALLLLCALLALAAAAPTKEPSQGACPRGCRCFAAAGAEDETAANCSSPAAALALGARLRVLRLSRFDDHLSVKEGAFRALSGLRELHLDHLGLVKVYPGAFRGLNQLETLDLSHNALSAGDEVSRALRDLPALRRLSLRGNNFGAAHGVAPALASRTLKFVDLGRCKLRALPPTVFAGLTHVRHIVLDGNFIREFVAAAFPRSAVSLDLSHNDIDRVSVAELNKLENVDSIELAENPIHCTCELLKISFEYNMNKAVVCAYPKQLMGKDLLKIKKHQVCAGHKKVKREAGNELDDEALSAEELANGDDLGTNPQEDDPENTVDTVNNPVEETDADDAEGDANAADTEEEEEETPEQPPDKLANEPKGPAVENARDEAEETEPEAPAASAEEKNEPDEEPEDVDGIAEERKSSKETEKIVLDDGINEEEGEVVDHAAPHAKSDTPPDEADDTEEQREEAAEPPADGEEEEPADDENVESTHVGAAIRNDDMENEDDVDENAQETSNVEPVDPVDPSDKEDNAEEEESAAENDDDVAEEDPPESLPASAYNHIKTEDENASQDKETGGENESEHNKEPVPDKAPIKTDNEDYSAPEVADPPLEEPTDSEIEDYSAPEVADPPKDDNIDDDDAETRDAVIPDAPNSGNEDPVKETPEEAESTEEENTPEHTYTMPAAAVPDSTLDADVEETDIGNSQGAAIAGEGARMETDPKTEDADNADGDVPDDDETETQNEDDDALNTVNNEDDTLSAVVPSRTNDNEGEDNSDEAGNAETDDEVENVPSNDNVVHSSGVGARVESEDREVDAADADEGPDGDANEDGNTSILAAGINVQDENKEETEALDPNPDNEDDTDAAGNTGVDAIENEGEENTEEENEDAKNSDVLVAAGLNNGSEEGEGDENVEESENLGTGLVDDAEETKNIEEEKTLEEELEGDRSHATLGHEDIDREISGAEHTNDAADNEPTEEKVEDGDEMPIIIPPQTSDKQNEDDNVDTNDDELERENDILDENENKHTGQSQTEGTGDTDGDEPKEYEEVIEGDEQQRKSPGGALSVAPTDNEDSEEEGSGNVLDALEDTAGDTHKYEDDWADAAETDNANENEAVPPLGNADSKEVAGDSGERVDEAARVDPSEEPPLVIAAGDDASEEEYTGSGAGAVVAGDVPLDRGDEEPASNEEDEGSGQAEPRGHVPAITGDVTEKPDDEDEDGSGKGVFIPVLPGRDRPEDTDVEVDEGMDGLDYNDKATTVAPVVAPEDEIVRRVHMPPQAAPPGVREEEPLPSEEDEAIPAEGGAVDPEGEPEDAQGRDRSDSGRALVPAESPASADDVHDTDAEALDENANAGEDGDLNVDVAPGMDDAKKGNIAEADEDRADGSEALNKDAAMSMNTIASYVVLGAIMIIVVFLLGYAVCRSRHQKSPSALDKDPENPDRELQEVNKPLINNHHPAAPEKE
ncbi:Protein windpipe, partial [Gryllus bimaculatus]